MLGELPDKTLGRLVSLAVDGVEVSRLSDALLFSGIGGIHRFERLLRSGDARLAELGAMRIEEIARFRPSTWSVVCPWMVELAGDEEAPGHEVGRSFLEWLERLGVRD